MEPTKQKTGSSGFLWILIFIILIVLGVAVFFGYKIIFPSGNGQGSGDGEEDTQEEGQDEDIVGEEEVGDEEAEDDEEEVVGEDPATMEDDDAACVQNPAPAGWTAVENPWAGYTAYRPGWYYRIFTGGEVLGIGPNPIPDASEYAGTIVIIKHDGTLAAEMANYTDRFDPGYTQTTVVAGCRDWTMLEGTEPPNELFDEMQTKVGFVTVDGEVFSVEYSIATASFPTHEAKFDTLIDIMVFTE